MRPILSILDVIKYLLPSGSHPAFSAEADPENAWTHCPPWPPDLFGTMATLAERSGCYAELGVVLSRSSRERRLKVAWAAQARQLGTEWRSTAIVPNRVAVLWGRLLRQGGRPVSSAPDTSTRVWKRLVVRLLAIADEASCGIGFLPPTHGEHTFALIAFDELIKGDRGKLDGSEVTGLPHSFASLIPADRMCVMPKALAPNVGCTLRSLSHNLAALPGEGTVCPRWFIAAEPTNEDDIALSTGEFNVLVVPYPYEISRSDFVATRSPEAGIDGYFSLQQSWLSVGGAALRRDMLSGFVIDLVAGARARLGGSGPPGVVHAVVLPETALDDQLADALAEDLAEHCPDLEILIAGVLRREGSRARNEAVLARLRHGGLARRVVQSKHHRWRLDGGQIRQYQLGRQLDQDRRWWEDIDVGDRGIAFGLVRRDVVISALVCEDLARFDPVLPVVNAVGPNIVVALLMDGPQLQARWPGRYATVLAEDPGSSVLTVTSLGMVRLARRHGEEDRRVVGLWKDASSSGATELLLPQGAHALLLSLRSKDIEQTTIDLRQDGSTAVSLTLSEVWPVELPNPPSWLAKP